MPFSFEHGLARSATLQKEYFGHDREGNFRRGFGSQVKAGRDPDPLQYCFRETLS